MSILRKEELTQLDKLNLVIIEQILEDYGFDELHEKDEESGYVKVAIDSARELACPFWINEDREFVFAMRDERESEIIAIVRETDIHEFKLKVVQILNVVSTMDFDTRRKAEKIQDALRCAATITKVVLIGVTTYKLIKKLRK